MDYDILVAPAFTLGIRIHQTTFNNPLQREATAGTLFREVRDEETDEVVLRQVPPAPPANTHYVIRSDDKTIDAAWEIYAGPFDVTTALEIAEALHAKEASTLSTKKK